MERLPRDFSPSRAISPRIATQSEAIVFSKESAPDVLRAVFSFLFSEKATKDTHHRDQLGGDMLVSLFEAFSGSGFCFFDLSQSL